MDGQMKRMPLRVMHEELHSSTHPCGMEGMKRTKTKFNKLDSGVCQIKSFLQEYETVRLRVWKHGDRLKMTSPIAALFVERGWAHRLEAQQSQRSQFLGSCCGLWVCSSACKQRGGFCYCKRKTLHTVSNVCFKNNLCAWGKWPAERTVAIYHLLVV